MSRTISASERSLSLTEELEKLEQSITLTLQEIDHNFSKAHRIVTSSILPLVEQYGEHSRSVWEASKFWKQFFEASANVSLSGYEELANDGDTTATTGEDTTAHGDSTSDLTPRRPDSKGNDTTVTGEPSGALHARRDDDESMLSDGDGSLTGSTPRPPATKSLSGKPQFADLGSPYEVLKREMQKEMEFGDGAPEGGEDESDTELLFQQHTARLPNMSMTPRQSATGAGGGMGHDFDELEHLAQEATRSSRDPLLHRVLDKNYRLMATPHKGSATTGVSPIRWKVTDNKKDDIRTKGKEKAAAPLWEESPTSSPEMEVPKLRSAAFMSPVRTGYKNKTATTASAKQPRTPGVSVQTPATAKKTRDVYQKTPTAARTALGDTDEITWESDSDDDVYGGMSPPKTINFALPPSKLLQTPAREASKRIVDDILLTAGAEPDESGEYSPTMVKTNADALDDTF